MIPEGIVDSEWPRIERRIVDMAIVLDRWQTNLGELTLGLTADGLYAATVGGVVLSIPRQVGKTFTVGVLIVALCIEFPGLVVLWSAHHGRTTTKTFRSLQAIVRRKGVAPYLAVNGIRVANGEQEILFANGSLLMFGAREHGLGRGMDAVDMIVFDEAQILGEKSLQDMIAATNQARHEHGALLFYMGTPPRPEDNGEAFTNKRNKALSGKLRNGVYVECSADPDADPDDRAQWAKANPSFPHHTPPEAMERMRENLPSVASWRLEAFGIWDDLKLVSLFGNGMWDLCGVEESAIDGPVTFGLAMTMDNAHAAIGASGFRDDDLLHVEPVEHRRGTEWIVPRAAQLQERHGGVLVVDGRGPAAFLIPDLIAAGVQVLVASTADVLDSCALMFDRVQQSTVRHLNYPELNAAVLGAQKRPVGDRWALGRKGAADISLLEAVVLAGWGASHAAPLESVTVSFL